MQQALDRHTALVQECKLLQHDVLKKVLVDVMHVEMGKSDFRTKSTVGIMLNGCVVDNMVVGGPAFNSRQIKTGDTVLKIDGKAVNDDNILTQLVGVDVPGSTVKVLVERQGQQQEVVLKRMDTVIIAGKLKLFDLFTRTKEKALEGKDTALPDLVDQCIQAWTDTTIADGEREATQINNFKTMQEGCGKSLATLEERLNSFCTVSQDIGGIDAELRKEVARLTAALDTSEHARSALESDLKSAQEKVRQLTDALEKCERDKEILSKEKAAMQKEWDATLADLAAKTRELADANSEIAELKKKISRDAEAIARLTSDVDRLTSDLEAEKLARNRTARELADEKSRTTMLEMSWNKTVVQRDGLQEQLDKLQDEYDKAQAALTAQKRMYSELEDRMSTSQRKVETLEHEKKNLEAAVDETEKKLAQEQDLRIQRVRKLEAELEVLSRERDLLERARSNCLVRLEELTEQYGQLKSQNSVLKTDNEGKTVKNKELELQLHDALGIKCQLQSQVDTLNPEKLEVQQRLRACEMDLQARKDELSKLVTENVALLAQLDSEKASHIERREQLMRAEEERMRAEGETSKMRSENSMLEVELRHSKSNLAALEQRLAQANVDLKSALEACTERANKSDSLEVREKQMEEMLAKSSKEIQHLREALERAETKMSEACKAQDDLRTKVNEAQLALHGAAGREQAARREVSDLQNSLEQEIKTGADKEAALLKERAYCRSLEKELAEAKLKCRTVEMDLVTARESERHQTTSLAELEVSLTSTRSSMSAEQTRLQQQLVLAQLHVEQMYKAAREKSSEVRAAEAKRDKGGDEPGSGDGGGRVSGAGEGEEGAASNPPLETGDSTSGSVKVGSENEGETGLSMAEMVTATCQSVHDLSKKVLRLQQQNANLLAQVGEVEEQRRRADTAGRDKYLAEEELTKIRGAMDKLKLEGDAQRKANVRLECEIQTEQDKLRDLRQEKMDADVHHKQVLLEAEKQRIELEGEATKLKDSLADAHRRLVELSFAREDAAQAHAFLSEAISGLTRIHRTVAPESAGGAYASVGLTVRIEGGACVVKEYDESMAPMLRVGHVLETVDAQRVQGLDYNNVMDLLVGPTGSVVTVGLRGPDKKDEVYTVSLERRVHEESMRSVSERTVDACARVARAEHEMECIKTEMKEVAADAQRKEEMLDESVRAREASNKQLLVLEERARLHDARIDALQAELDVAQMQLASSKEQVVEMDERNMKNLDVISHSQKKVFDLEQSLAAAEAERARLRVLADKLEQTTTDMRNELTKTNEMHSKHVAELSAETEALHVQLLQHARQAAASLDAEKRELSLKRSLQDMENERSSLKRDNAVLSSDLNAVRQALELRTKDLNKCEDLLAQVRQHCQELEARLAEAKAECSIAAGREKVLEEELRDARSKSHQLLEAMQGKVREWQGVGMVVRCGSRSSAPTIKELRVGGAAWRSGLLNEGDLLISIDGTKILGMDARQIQTLILGPEGTTVNIEARSARGGRNFSVDLVRGHLGGEKEGGEESWDSQVKEAIEVAAAMHAHGTAVRDVVHALLQEMHRRDQDLDATLHSVETQYHDARLSWQDVSSSLVAFTSQITSYKTAGMGFTEVPALEDLKCDAALVARVQSSSNNAKASLARVADLALEALRQIGEGVRVQEDLQRQLTALDHFKGNQLQLETEVERLRADADARTKALRIDNSALAARLAEAEREALASKTRAKEAVKAVEQAEATSVALCKQKDALVRECAAAVEAQRSLHAAIRRHSTSCDGVGMLLRLSGDKCFVKSLTPGGPAADSQLKVDDQLLSVNGHDVAGKSIAQVTELFVGPTGSAVTIRAFRDIPYAQRLFDTVRDSWSSADKSTGDKAEKATSFEVVLTRGSITAKEGIQYHVEEDIKMLKKMHADLGLLEGMRSENADLQWALKNQQDENRICHQQLHTLKAQVEQLEKDLAEAVVRAQAAEQQCAMLEEEKVILENKFADSASGRLEKTGASEDKLLAAERERDAALQARDFLERRQNHIEAESSKLQQSIDTKQQEVDRAWEELTVAQATIQALQRRVSELSEGKSEEEVGRSFAEIEELRSKLRISESQLQSMQREMSELKKQLQLHSTGKVPSSGASTPRTPRTASMTSRPGSAKKVGIGLVITDSAPHRVTSVVPGGAAHACGMIREGDTLVAVDENSVEDLDVAGVRALLLGESGTKVDLELARAAPQDNEYPVYQVRVMRGVQGSKPRFI